MDNYLGETEVQIKDSPYAEFTREDWAMLYIEKYGQIDGDHHKQWVLDQVARILKGSPITLKLAKWGGGTEEWRFEVGESQTYNEWVRERLGERDEETGLYEYRYETGIAP